MNTPNKTIDNLPAMCNFVIHTIKLEAEALVTVSNALCKEQIGNFLNLLLTNEGTLFITGVGKSAIIAKKAVATFNSIGFKSSYIHPTDAGHGDIGAIGPQDLVLMLSKSGESDELLQLLPHLRSRSRGTLLITGNAESTLARAVQYKITLPLLHEACPHNLVPTVTSSATLALLDGIAVAVMIQQKVTPQNFATNHPAGQLGKRLTLTISDIMHRGAENPTASPSTPLLDIVQILSEKSLGAVNIVDNGQKLIGLITDGDVRRAIKKFTNHGSLQIDEIFAQNIMSTNPIVTHPNSLAFAALRLMQGRDRPLSVLPVIDHETKTCVGLVRLHDVVRCGIA